MAEGRGPRGAFDRAHRVEGMSEAVSRLHARCPLPGPEAGVSDKASGGRSRLFGSGIKRTFKYLQVLPMKSTLWVIVAEFGHLP